MNLLRTALGLKPIVIPTEEERARNRAKKPFAKLPHWLHYEFIPKQQPPSTLARVKAYERSHASTMP